MTTIKKSNERIERKQVSDALTSAESNITTAQGDISALDARITVLEGGVNGTPPTELKGIPTTRTTVAFDTAEMVWLASVTASETAYDTWKTLLEETAAEGVLEFLAIYQVANASDRDVQARLTIDGTVVWLSSTTYWSATGDNSDGAILCGTGTSTGTTTQVALGHIPFNTSFKLDFKKTENAAGTVEMGAFYKYYLTG